MPEEFSSASLLVRVGMSVPSTNGTRFATNAPRQSLRDGAVSALASDSVDKALLEPLDIPLEPICLISKIFSRVL